MKELLRVTLNAKQVREACEQWALSRASIALDANVCAEGIANDTVVTVTFSKRRAPRKPRTNGNGVASAGPLSEQEQRFGVNHSQEFP